MKKLQRSPPLVAMLPAAEILARQPLVGALPADVRKLLLAGVQEFNVKNRSVLFEEGGEAKGVWLIATGTATVRAGRTYR